MLPTPICRACGEPAESQGRVPADPFVEIVACPSCGEFWIQPAPIDISNET
jgi:hypothetical protein